MKLHIFSLLFCLCIVSITYAQFQKLSGKVLNDKNEPIAGVTIKVTSGEGTSTNVDGQFELNIAPGKKYEVRFSAVGYKAKMVSDVEVLAGQVNELNLVLETESKDLNNIVITASSNSRKETVNSLITYQKNTNTIAQVVSAEAIRRSPDKNTGEVLKRVPGTSIQEGKYLVVRGLADRYNQALLNGVLLGTTEPDRKSFSFDIFPSSIIDNIIINKAFVPEYPGEWAGGLVQVNTKDVPSANFLSIQVGTGFNSQTIGKDFYTYMGGKTDWLGFDDGTRGLPAGFPTSKQFTALSRQEQIDYAKKMENTWSKQPVSSKLLPLLNTSFQLSGGINTHIGKNKLGGVVALTYNRSLRNLQYNNSIFVINEVDQSNRKYDAVSSFSYSNNKYSQDVLWGGLANVTLQLGNHSKISSKTLVNVNATDYAIDRIGKDYEGAAGNIGDNVRATELAFRSNTFFNTQLTGDHSIPILNTKLHWYGSFGILDQYIPDQRRIRYTQNGNDPTGPYLLDVSSSQTSQVSGSRYFGFLNEYIYTGGGDASKTFNWGSNTQTIKGGYMVQVKDRLFDAKPFAVYIPGGDNMALRQLPADKIFDPSNFGDGSATSNQFSFNELTGSQYRYVANSILNAGFLQLDNQFASRFRVVWGLRVEDFDQVIGSMNAKDPRHVHTRVTDYLPALNLTYKLNHTTNLRLSGSQTVIRPEFRELSDFAFFDFELGATVTGIKSLLRTKITNADLRYEMYPRVGELFTIGLFYKYFRNPIELYFNQSGTGSSSTFNYINADNANSFGAELEMRKKLDFSHALRNFTFQSNISYIYNRVKWESAKLDRPMQGQSPYVINASLQYDLNPSGFSTTLLFNQIGRRILYVGGNDIPPVWEAPRALLDFQIAKKVLNKKGELKLNISDLLNQRAVYYHDLQDDGKYSGSNADALAIDRKYGTNYSLSFSYNIK
jgi:TonB-dependent receptor